MTAAPRPLPAGFRLVPGHLGRDRQEALLAALRAVFARAPIYTPRMPRSGRPPSVCLTNCGARREGPSRYHPPPPEPGAPGPRMPDIVLEAGAALAGYPPPPESCLINYYGAEARMGLHQDRDEADFAAPVVSLSLGDTCLFR